MKSHRNKDSEHHYYLYIVQFYENDHNNIMERRLILRIRLHNQALN